MTRTILLAAAATFVLSGTAFAQAGGGTGAGAGASVAGATGGGAPRASTPGTSASGNIGNTGNSEAQGQMDSSVNNRLYQTNPAAASGVNSSGTGGRRRRFRYSVSDEWRQLATVQTTSRCAHDPVCC